MTRPFITDLVLPAELSAGARAHAGPGAPARRGAARPGTGQPPRCPETARPRQQPRSPLPPPEAGAETRPAGTRLAPPPGWGGPSGPALRRGSQNVAPEHRPLITWREATSAPSAGARRCSGLRQGRRPNPASSGLPPAPRSRRTPARSSAQRTCLPACRFRCREEPAWRDTAVKRAGGACAAVSPVCRAGPSGPLLRFAGRCPVRTQDVPLSPANLPVSPVPCAGLPRLQAAPPPSPAYCPFCAEKRVSPRALVLCETKYRAGSSWRRVCPRFCASGFPGRGFPWLSVQYALNGLLHYCTLAASQTSSLYLRVPCVLFYTSLFSLVCA